MSGFVLASSGDSALAAVIVTSILALAIGSTFWSFRRGEQRLAAWAEANSLRLLRSEFRWFAKGPYFWRSSKHQTVYRITVADDFGNIREGWARCGGWFFGLFTDHVDVRWDQEQASPLQPRGFPVVMPTARQATDESRRPDQH